MSRHSRWPLPVAASRFKAELTRNRRCFWYLWQCNRILNNLTTFAGAFVTIFAAVLAINTPGMDAGAVGLSVTYACEWSFHAVYEWSPFGVIDTPN